MSADQRKTMLGWAVQPPPDAQYADTSPSLPPYPAQSYPPQQPVPQPYPAQAYPAYPVYAAPAAPEPAQPTPRRPIVLGKSIGPSPRLRFIRLTYLHLLLAILAFAGLESLLVTNPFLGVHVSAPLVKFALGARWNWGVVLGVFMVVSWIADRWASHARSRFVQYLGLAFYVCAEALIFVPLLAIVQWKTAAILARGGAEPHIVRDAAYVTIAIFTMLTLSVLLSRKDFSFLRSGLMMVSGAALALIFMSIGFGFDLGLVFSVAMVLLAAGYILYQTSQVLAHYDPGSHVAAALALFSSVALMFWYVIRIFLRARN
ncbi:MAG TPA: Bax inhibitor-1 family protein [Kofleriaceae bacterium]|nr:Bax inhibitor-1 family protein [Kofleriaceae bacterium]